MTGAYLKYTELFSKLSPFEVNHLTEILLCKIEDCFEGKLVGVVQKNALTERDLKFALVNAMREALLQTQEREITQQQMKLNQKKTEVFSNDYLAA
jgi:hypothetical protein